MQKQIGRHAAPDGDPAVESERLARVPLLPAEESAQLAALRLRLRGRQLEAGRLRVLVRHSCLPVDAQARASRLRQVETEIERLSELIRHLEAAGA